MSRVAGYCPVCGAALEAQVLDGRRRGVCPACQYVAWGNARPCAGALVVRHGKVLLLRRAVEPFYGEWDIPGGFCEEDEHPALAAVREVREETGLDIELTDLFGLWVDQYRDHHTLNVFYLARPLGGRLRLNAESSGAAWFAPDALPERIAFENGRAVLRTWRAGTETPVYRRGVDKGRILIVDDTPANFVLYAASGGRCGVGDP